VYVALTGVVGCTGSDQTTAFCEQLATARDEGPIFPTRTDGTPSADTDALDRLQDLADSAPEEIADELTVLAEHASDLVRQSQIGAESGLSISGSGRWSQSVVESAQTAVFRYAAEQCDIDLTRATGPGAEGDGEDPPPVLPDD
jgi:hypothetical protein